MNMMGWSTWGRIEDPVHGTFQVYHHDTGAIFAIKEGTAGGRTDEFVALAQMNDWLER